MTGPLNGFRITEDFIAGAEKPTLKTVIEKP